MAKPVLPKITFRKNNGTQNADKDERKIPDINLFVISDLHVCFPEDMSAIESALKNCKYDCVLLLGDIFVEDVKHIASFIDMPCYYVLGNHDYWGQNDGIKNAVNLDGKTVTVNGVRISGFSGCPRYKQGNFAMRDEQEAKEILQSLGKTDILVSHESPFQMMNTNRSHSGFQAITDFLKEKRPKMHIFGHHHCRHEETVNGIREICVYKAALIGKNRIKYYL